MDDLLAADGAGVAGVHVGAYDLLHSDGVNLIDAFHFTKAIVQARHATGQILSLHCTACAVFVEGEMRPVERCCDPLGNIVQPLLVGERDGRLAAHGHCLELLRTHDGAEPRAAGELFQVVADISEAD